MSSSPDNTAENEARSLVSEIQNGVSESALTLQYAATEYHAVVQGEIENVLKGASQHMGKLRCSLKALNESLEYSRKHADAMNEDAHGPAEETQEPAPPSLSEQAQDLRDKTSQRSIQRSRLVLDIEDPYHALVYKRMAQIFNNRTVEVDFKSDAYGEIGNILGLDVEMEGSDEPLNATPSAEMGAADDAVSATEAA